MLSKINTKVNYEIEYDENKEIELPFFNTKYWETKNEFNDVNIKVMYGYSYEKNDVEKCSGSPSLIIYIDDNNNYISLIKNSQNKININLKKKIITHHKKTYGYDFLKLTTAKIYNSNIKIIDVSIKTELKKIKNEDIKNELYQLNQLN